MSTANETIQAVTWSDRLVQFIQKNRIILLAVIVAGVAGVALTGAVFAFLESSQKKSIAAAEGLIARYDELRAQTDDDAKTKKIDALIADALEAGKGKGFAASRSLALAGALYADKKEWSEAQKNWLAAADNAPTSYLAPIALYNAASAAEEFGDGKKALELYSRCADQYKDSFPLAARALFAVGRIDEDMKDFAAANAAYKKIIEQWPDDSWTKLAHSRILSIAAKEGAK